MMMPSSIGNLLGLSGFQTGTSLTDASMPTGFPNLLAMVSAAKVSPIQSSYDAPLQDMNSALQPEPPINLAASLEQFLPDGAIASEAPSNLLLQSVAVNNSQLQLPLELGPKVLQIDLETSGKLVPSVGGDSAAVVIPTVSSTSEKQFYPAVAAASVSPASMNAHAELPFVSGTFVQAQSTSKPDSPTASVQLIPNGEPQPDLAVLQKVVKPLAPEQVILNQLIENPAIPKSQPKVQNFSTQILPEEHAGQTIPTNNSDRPVFNTNLHSASPKVSTQGGLMPVVPSATIHDEQTPKPMATTEIQHIRNFGEASSVVKVTLAQSASQNSGASISAGTHVPNSVPAPPQAAGTSHPAPSDIKKVPIDIAQVQMSQTNSDNASSKTLRKVQAAAINASMIVETPETSIRSPNQIAAQPQIQTIDKSTNSVSTVQMSNPLAASVVIAMSAETPAASQRVRSEQQVSIPNSGSNSKVAKATLQLLPVKEMRSSTPQVSLQQFGTNEIKVDQPQASTTTRNPLESVSTAYPTPQAANTAATTVFAASVGLRPSVQTENQSPEILNPLLAEATAASRTSEIELASAKASDESRPKLSAKPFAEALINQIKSIDLSEGRTQVNLNPRGLGAMSIEVISDQDGAAKIVVRAENPIVLQALRDDREVLAQSLGLSDNSNFEFQPGSDDQGANGSGAEQHASQGQSSPMQAAAALHSLAVINDGQLDLLT